MGQMVYLASPIDQAGGRVELKRQRQEVVDLLTDRGWVVYQPQKAWTVPYGAERGPWIRRVNDAAIREADLVVALMPPGVPSIGTPMEVEYAAGLGKPVYVIGADTSWHLAGDDRVMLVDTADEIPKEPVAQTPNRNMKVQALAASAELPTRALPGDAGFDLYVSQDTKIPPGGFVDIPCDVAVQLPPGVWSMLVGRSSTLRKRNLLVNTGIIDAGYRGPLYAGVWNLGSEPVVVEAGDRVAQLIPFPLTAEGIVPEFVPELDESERGNAGFGSTGE